MRIAVLLKDRCKPKTCSLECIKFCPRVRAGDETIVQGEDSKPIISEDLCVGCGICIHKCPFDAIKIIGLAEELETDLIHQFGKNGFRLFRLPIPKKGSCIGILGPNGIGKTTAIRILSGQIVPNLGNYDEEILWDDIIEYYAGTELSEHFKKIANISANRHAEIPLYAKGIDFVRFYSTICKEDKLYCFASVNCAWKLSLEVGVKVTSENFRTLDKKKILSAYFTFSSKENVDICSVMPLTEEEIRRYEMAEKRLSIRKGIAKN